MSTKDRRMLDEHAKQDLNSLIEPSALALGFSRFVQERAKQEYTKQEPQSRRICVVVFTWCSPHAVLSNLMKIEFKLCDPKKVSSFALMTITAVSKCL